MRLRQADLEALVGFLADVGGLEFDEPYPVAFVARLRNLVPCDALAYQDIDLQARRFNRLVDPGSSDPDDDDEGYWRLGPCPISDYRARTGDLSTVRMSDVISRQRYRELPIYRDYFHPLEIDHMIDLGLPAPPLRHRSFIFFRTTGSGDFSERDCAILEMLRPHLRALEAHAALRRQLSESPASDAGGASDVYARLTRREREIVVLVAEGKTNAQIAAQLWVAPSTVKKHLEHVYEKLDVRGRTVAARFVPNARWLD